MKNLRPICAILAISSAAFSIDVMAGNDAYIDGLRKAIQSPPSSSPHEASLKEMSRRSDLIIRGVLVDIRERLSMESIPYTFATYRVKEVISGAYPDPELTVKFVGGEFPNGNRLTASNSPTVRLGEESILMVQQSIDTGCDFVDCEAGRFVIENGMPIASNKTGVVVREDGRIDYTDPSAPDKSFGKIGGSSSQVSRFTEYLKSLNSGRGEVGQRTFLSADSSKPFKAYPALVKAGRAPEMTDEPILRRGDEIAESQFEKWEVKQLKENNGNPLLSAKLKLNENSK
ncbi:MAG: hypothetical protein JNN30_17150 [Rhodanobacteraceae bacterium]|nr:hypothetical protein [Rhodanobacteraceae bacterium]